MGSQLHNPVVLTTSEQNPQSNEYESEWVQAPVLTLQRETLSSLPGIEPRFIDGPASNLVPYPLSYPASPIYLNNSKTNRTITCVSISLDSDKQRQFRVRHRRNPALHCKAEITNFIDNTVRTFLSEILSYRPLIYDDWFNLSLRFVTHVEWQHQDVHQHKIKITSFIENHPLFSTFVSDWFVDNFTTLYQLEMLQAAWKKQ